jgi:glycosyltransferase involved in cell wall biosynthesis
MIRLSVVVITLNEEKNLERCLQTVNYIADEILVVDSGSADQTLAIAEKYKARVIHQPFLGYVEQKNFATEQAINDWIFSIDADEAISPELEASIKAIKNKQEFPAYRLSRLTNYCGSWIRHCGWYPDKKVRLYDRTKGSWRGDRIHERWELNDYHGKIGDLRGDLRHYSYYTISDHLKQIEKFSEILAQSAVERGRQSSLFDVWARPKWKFITDYIIRLGFLDGYAGYLVCKYSAFATFVKYSKIRQYNKLKKQARHH